MSRLILNSKQVELTINRLCHQLIENHDDFSQTCILGLQNKGVFVSQQICKRLKELLPKATFRHGTLDITFYRDDYRRRDTLVVPGTTQVDFSIENQKVILVDDVLYTGRTIRAAMDALLAFGRPSKVELLVFIDRKYSRHLPIEPDYTGKAIDTIDSDTVKVIVNTKENGVWLNTQPKKNAGTAKR